MTSKAISTAKIAVTHLDINKESRPICLAFIMHYYHALLLCIIFTCWSSNSLSTIALPNNGSKVTMQLSGRGSYGLPNGIVRPRMFRQSVFVN